MNQIPLWLLPALIFLTIPVTYSEEENVKQALVQFMDILVAGNPPNVSNWGWNMTSDPCNDRWVGVSCYTDSQTVRRIVLDGFSFTGTLDASLLCMARSLAVLSLEGTNIAGSIPEEIGNCQRLSHLYVSGNRFTGNIPDSISQLNNLKRLEISNNDFSGSLPDISHITGLISFLAQNNQLSGPIPNFDFSNIQKFNVSNNYFSGQIPEVRGKFFADSFLGNPLLCGKPLQNACPPSNMEPPPSPPSNKKEKRSSTDQFLIFSGYIILALVVVILFVYICISKRKPKQKINDIKAATDSNSKPSDSSSDYKTSGNNNRSANRSEYSITSAESGAASTSLVVLRSPLAQGLKFQDLLRAPAELLGRGKHGSLYKVMFGDGAILAVKRMKDWNISCEDFKWRMQRLNEVNHSRVLPPLAFYCSQQEKLLVYEYQPNGTLFKLLHGSQSGQVFDWGTRLSIAAVIAEALAFMHKGLSENGIAHGNMKSTNILFDKNMEPIISEYGLMEVENQDQSLLSQIDNNSPSRNDISSTFKADVYGFGVIVLELLTGRLVQNNGFDLARWVHSVVKEEWTVEVFDRTLIAEGANEERMVNLLQVGWKCINPSADERPSMNEVYAMINSIKEEEERSLSSDT